MELCQDDGWQRGRAQLTEKFEKPGTFRGRCVDIGWPLTMAAAAVALSRSFPVGEDRAETDRSTSNGPLIGGYWYWPAARADELVAK